MAALRSISAHSHLAAPSAAVAPALQTSTRRAQVASFTGLRRVAGASSGASSAATKQWTPAGSAGARGRRSGAARANWGQEVVWADAPIRQSERVAELLYAVTLDVSHLPEITSGYLLPGQFVQVKVADSKPAFLAIACAPQDARASGTLEFLIKAQEGSTAALITAVKPGGQVAVSTVMGKGFNLDALAPVGDLPTLLLFATGSGISPIRALIEGGGLAAGERSDVRLYFGVRNEGFTPYEDRFASWESSGVKVIPVHSNPTEGWTGETGFVQAAYERALVVSDGSKAAAVLCGHKGMAEDITSILTSQGVPKEKILLNF